jgi:MFS family permease
LLNGNGVLRSGIDPLDRDAMDDRRILYATAFLRALSIGMAGVLISLFLSARGFDPRWIFFVVSAGLSGAALASLAVTLAGHQFARRRALMALSVVSVLGGVAFVFLRSPGAIALAAFVGMVNGMGRDRGAAAVMEQAILPATATDAQRTRVFAWYNVLQDTGHALGALLAGLPALLQHVAAVGMLPAFQIAMLLPAIFMLATVPLYGRLSPRVEPRGPTAAAPLSPDSRGVLWRISALFALDSIGGGFLTTALIVYFFAERFGVGSATVSVLVFTARIANAGSHLGAAWLARRIGLLNTIVWTHMPSSLLLLTLPWAPSFPVAAVLFLLREGLVEMDVPTRQSYVMAVVQPAERLTASGVTSLVRLGGWAVAPMIAGGLMQSTTLGMPLVVGAATKVVYDFLLYVSFRAHRPPEERT